MFTLSDLKNAASLVYRHMLPTPQYNWPLLSKHAGCNVWVKHENHTPTAAFKVRGGICLLDSLMASDTQIDGIISATRGNHGQSLSFAASKVDMPVTIVVPECNNVDQNRLIKGFGANLVVHGEDFEAAREHSLLLQKQKQLTAIASFQQELVLGVATYAYELFNALTNLDTVYVPIGMGSGICGLIKTRDLLGLDTEIVGVVSKGAPAFKLSFDAGQIIQTPSADTMADGVATRKPMDEAFEIIKRGASRVITVSDLEIAQAMQLYYQATHNVAEGAGAVSLAGLLSEHDKMLGKNIGVILSGGNIDFESFARHINSAVSTLAD